MKSLGIAFVVAAAVAASGTQQVVSPNVKIATIQARALEGNAFGDPVEQRIAVYLPPGYDAASQRYPVVYLLHGIADSYEVWTRFCELPAKLDRMIADGAIPPLIVAMPNAKNRFLGGYYVNSPVSGNWEDYIAEDVVAFVDKSFRTLPTRDSRAVSGHSMGGLGAINLGMKRPEIFSVVYAISPCCLDMVEDIGFGNNTAYREFLTFKSYTDADLALKQGQFYSVALLGMLSAFAPNPDAPLKIDLPVKRDGNQLVPMNPGYDRFRNAFLVRTAPKYAANLRRLRLLQMDYGYNDQFAHIPAATASFSRVLTEHRIPHVVEAYDGDHREHVLQRLQSVVFPILARHLRRK
jgi:S-formylglutathione hydrolase FrmB